MLDIVKAAPDRLLLSGIEAGFTWAVVHNTLGFRNGYVQVPAGHPWQGREPDAEVHGGFTYGSPDADGAGWWVGFDTGHFGDGQDLSLPHEVDMTNSFNGHIWTTQEVAEECRTVCQQAAVASFPSPEKEDHDDACPDSR